MELKYLVILSVVGVAASFAVPEQKSDLEANFPASSSSDSETPTTRDKRDLFKKFKKHHDTVYVNRGYESSSGYDNRPGREVHHHHYSYPNAPVEQPAYRPYPAPSHDYHHYHGAGGYQQQGSYAGHGSSYYNGGYSAGSSNYPRPNYGEGGYAHYGGVGGYNAPPPASANPVASSHNAVDRGQGAAAVNNIAIIHARAGSANTLAEPGSQGLPKALPVNIEDVLNSMED